MIEKIYRSLTPSGKEGHQHILCDELPALVRGQEVDDLKKETIWEQNYRVTVNNGNDIEIKINHTLASCLTRAWWLSSCSAMSRLKLM